MRCKWISLVHVRPDGPRSPLPEGSAGAFGHVAALANSEGEYREAVATALARDGLIVVGFEDLACVSAPTENLDDDLRQLLDDLSEGDPIQLREFFNYLNDDS